MTNAQITTDTVEIIKGEINGYRDNKVIMDFVTNEANNKVAFEINAKIGGCMTAKGVAFAALSRPNIAAKIEEYVTLGLIGCFMASQQVTQ